MQKNLRWIEKYKPTKSFELIGNYKAIHSIKEWLKNYEIEKIKKYKANLIIVGPHGIGKTTIIKVLLNKPEYQLQIPNLDKITDNVQIKKHVNALLKGHNIPNLLNDNKNKKKNVILIDHVENIISTTEKNALEDLRIENEKNKYMPIIFICDTQHNNFLANLKKKCFVVNLYLIKRENLMQLLEKIIKKEKIIIDNEFIKNQIIDHVQGDMRRLVNVLEDLHMIYKNKIIDEDVFEKYLYNFSKKEINIGLFDSTKLLFDKFDCIENILILYGMDKSTLPLMIHEHYFDHIINKFIKYKDKLDILSVISESLSFGDFVEHHIYNDQDWDMQEFHGFYTCAVPSYYLNSRKKFKKYERFRFPSDISKTNIKYSNKKNITNINHKFANATIYDYVQMNKIIKYLLSENNLKSVKYILKGYGLDINQIETLLKIDKIISTKTNGLSSKLKKIIS